MARLKLSLFSFLMASRRPGRPYFSSLVMFRWLVPFLLWAVSVVICGWLLLPIGACEASFMLENSDVSLFDC